MKLKLAAVLGLLVVALVAVAASLGVLPGPGAATATTSFLTAAATSTDVTDEVAATGTVQPTDTYQLAFGGVAGAPAVTWPVAEVKVGVGDHVAKGDVLASADTTSLQAQIDDATRSREVADIGLTQAATNLANATTTTAKQQTQIAYYNAQSADAKAIANQTALLVELDKATIVAPADGIVTAVAIHPGDTAPATNDITLAATTLQVTTSVVESDIGKISVGQKATVTISAVNATIQGTVSSIAPAGTSSGNSGVVSFAVAVLLDAPPQTVKPGMSADVSVITATATNVVAIPSRALSGSAGSYTVRVVAADGSVSVREVTVGLITSSLAEIQSGLQAGEQVVTGTSSTQAAVNQVGGGIGGGGRGGTTFPGGGVIVQGR